MSLITPTLTPLVVSGAPLTNITPFTYRDGLTYVEVLQCLRVYITQTLVPEVERIVGESNEWTEAQILALTQYVDAAVEAIINDSIEVQDPVVAALINDIDSATRQAIDAITVTDSNVDTKVAALFADDESATRAETDALYISADEIDAVTATNIASDTSETYLALKSRVNTAFDGAVGYRLSQYPVSVVDDDWSAAIQALIANPLVRSIIIDIDIKITTVEIPINRSLRISSPKTRNITGAPLITIRAGGEGFKFIGTGNNLSNGCVFEDLSFTSEGAVVGAFTGNNVTGCYWVRPTFINVQGAAIDIGGIFYDSAIDHLVAMDCGDTGKVVLGIGGSASDPNRITLLQPRIERSATTQLHVRGASYSIDIFAPKFHEHTLDNAPLVLTDATSLGINIMGGQIKVSDTVTGISLYGANHRISNVSMQGDSSGYPGSKGIEGPAARTIITGLYSENVETVINLTGSENVISNCNFVAPALVKTGDFGTISGCVAVALKKRSDLDYNYSVGSYGAIVNCTLHNWNDNIARAFTITGTGSMVTGNRVYRGTSGPTNAISVATTALTSIIRNNIGRGVTNVVNGTASGATIDTNPLAT